MRPRHPESGCVLNYVAQCDPQGKLPPWLVNKVTHTLGPRMIKDIRKAALGYIQWKQSQSHLRKPWRYPEEITVPRILVSDCWDPAEMPIETKDDVAVKMKKKENKTISLPSTPTTTQFKSITSNFNTSNGNGNGNGISLPGSTTGSPLPQKKSKKKFKFKFDKFDK